MSKTLRLSAFLAAAFVTLAPAMPHAMIPRPQKAAITKPMVVAAEPDAADAGYRILQKGGTAIDAAVAVQATLSLVEPQSSGIGGGAFMMYYDAKTRQTTVYYGREAAPKSATPDRFLRSDGKLMTYPEAVTSGRATGVPGAMHMLERAQKEHGKLKWSQLFEDPIRLAETGFVIPKRLGYNLQVRDFPQKHTADFQAYFSDGKGGLLKTGDTLKNPAYATTLRTIATDGMAVFRSGPIAEAIVAKVNQDPLPGGMTLGDLAAYIPKSTAPVCITYRATYRVCSARPPSGGVSLLQGLKIVEQFPVNDWGKDDPRSWQVILEAERRLYADRDKYMADEDFVPVPVDGLMADDYIDARASTITLGKVAPAPTFGTPKGAPKFLDDKTIEPGGTTHFVIVDAYGNAVSMTTTVESLFGTGRMVGGFFLNNQITDFSWSQTTPDGMRAANGVEGGKHPRSAMSPTLIFDLKGNLIGMIGSPGGPSIISYNLKTLVGVMDFGLNMQDAINLGHVIAKGENIRVEQNRLDPKIIQGLKDMGYALQEVTGEESGLNGALKNANGDFIGGADPRRNGAIRGN